MLRFRSWSEERRSDAFAMTFAGLADQVRRDPFRVGLLPFPLQLAFLKMPLPFPTEFWIAEKSGRPIARIGASLSPAHPGLVYAGFYEADLSEGDALEATRGLFARLECWVRDQGARRIVGPVNFNTWFPYRFRTEDSSGEKFSWEPINPLEYPRFWQDCGFRECQGYHSQAMGDFDALMAGSEKGYQKAISSGFRFREIDGARLMDVEVPLLYQLSMKSFTDNFLFEPIPLEVFRQLYVPIANKVDVSLSRFIVAPDGKEVGFFFNFVDGKYAVFKSLALAPEARGFGLSNAVFHECVRASREKGIEIAIAALVRSGAQSESYGRKGSEHWRHHYSIYEKVLGETS